MKIAERLKDPFGKNWLRAERVRAESISRKEIPEFIRDVLEPGLKRRFSEPKMSFVYSATDPLNDGRPIHDTSYGSGQIILNWTYLSPRLFSSEKHIRIIALAAVGHELGHYLQDSLKTTVFKETFGIEERAVDPSGARALEAASEDQCDYVAGIFVRYLANKGAITIGVHEREALERIHKQIGAPEGLRSMQGHGSASHRLDLFMRGLGAENLEEEIRLIFRMT